ncbi:MAG: family 78 glycoside hydrolase catalytic domain [Tetrasphaera sp.]|nr:family 78 glycoside hydrolase catalytic domain [Tetrasphaera sp.]
MPADAQAGGPGLAHEDRTAAAAISAALDQAIAITAVAPRHTVVDLRTDFALAGDRADVTSAVLHATAHGVYEASLNGRRVSDSVLDPGWTAYEWRLQVQSVDVTALLADDNRLTLRLAEGWYRGDLGFEHANANYGDEVAVLAALVVTYADGDEQVIRTGPQWTAATTDTTFASLYHGQTIDARLRSATPTPLAIRTTEIDRNTLVAQVGPPIQRQEILHPQAIWRSPAGRTLVDFGQNLVGWLRFTVTGPAGTEIVLRHAEVLEEGELGTRPLRAARATDTFILSGDRDEFEPTFTFHGFRYAEITSHPAGDPDTEGLGTEGLDTEGLDTEALDLEAVVVHSAMTRTGWFECSDPQVNQLVSNSVWGHKGNFLDVPTDCPQRDERLGWTGDLSAYAATACYQFDCADVLHKWLLDLAEETRHHPHGWVPNVVPDVLKHAHFPPEFAAMIAQWAGATCIWGDAAVWVPQALWWAYADPSRLAAHYPAMRDHLTGVEASLSENGLWDKGFQFGDWLDPDAAPHEPWNAKADKGVVATACLYRSATFAAEAARQLGLDEEMRWVALAERTRAAFTEHYVGDDGRIHSDCATVYALAIHFALVTGDRRDQAAARLAELVRARGFRVSTGFAGTPFVTWALSETGYVEEAYRLLLERECPSWLYPVTMGATTIWERWDSMLTDGSINPGDMTSFNHYALGAVADWLYQVVGGIRPAAPGYARLLIQPTPGPGLDWARAVLDTRQGRVECGWRREGEQIRVEVSVPDGIPAQVVLPDGRRSSVVGGRHMF